MQFYKFKDAIRSWSNWVLAGVVVTLSLMRMCKR